MGDCLKNLFVQQFDSFQNINCFSKLYNDIFARVYLFYHYDELQNDSFSYIAINEYNKLNA